MFRDPVALLKYEAKKNKAIAHVMDNISTISREEIEQGNYGGLPWIKKELLRYHNAQLIEKTVQFGHTPDRDGILVQWTGPRIFVNVSKNKFGSAQLEVSENDLLWFPKNGGVYIGSIYVRGIDPKLYENIDKLGEIKHSEYLRKYQEHLEKKHGANFVETTDENRPMFQIIRH